MAAAASFPLCAAALRTSILEARSRWANWRSLHSAFANRSARRCAHCLEHRINAFSEFCRLASTPLEMPIDAAVTNGLDCSITAARRGLDQVARERSRLFRAIIERVHQHRDRKRMHLRWREVLDLANRERHPKCKRC